MHTNPWRCLAALAASVGLSVAPAVVGSAAVMATPPAPHTSNGCGRAPVVGPGVSTTQHISVDGVQRSYVLHIPSDYEPETALPVVLAFHGRKSDGSEMEAYSGLSGLRAIVVYPNGLPDDEGKTGWAGAPYAPEADDIGFVREVLNRLDDRLCVDDDRIFATGKSNGGGFTALLACQMPHRIAAFAPVAGAFYPQSSVGCATAPPVPMLEFHGTDDPIMEYQGGTSHGERFPSIPAWLTRWAHHDHCRDLNRSAVGADVHRLQWSRCAGHTGVVHYAIIGGGHTWPGELVDSGPGSSTQTISATQIMWDFFLQHPLHP